MQSTTKMSEQLTVWSLFLNSLWGLECLLSLVHKVRRCIGPGYASKTSPCKPGKWRRYKRIDVARVPRHRTGANCNLTGAAFWGVNHSSPGWDPYARGAGVFYGCPRKSRRLLQWAVIAFG